MRGRGRLEERPVDVDPAGHAERHGHGHVLQRQPAPHGDTRGAGAHGGAARLGFGPRPRPLTWTRRTAAARPRWLPARRKCGRCPAPRMPRRGRAGRCGRRCRRRCGSASGAPCSTARPAGPPHSEALVSGTGGEGKGRGTAPEGPVTDRPPPRRCGRARAAAGARPGAADAQLLPRPDQLRPGRVLAVAGGGTSHGFQISFTRPLFAPGGPGGTGE